MKPAWSAVLLAAGVAASGCDNQPLDATDREPPAAIRNLTATRPIDTTLLLGWTAPGDDGDAGQVSTYEVRWSTESLTEDRGLAAAAALTFPEWPAPARQRRIVLGNLPRGRSLQFRLRAADEVPNWSAWSNVATAASANLPPEASFLLWPDSMAVGDTLHVDASATFDAESEAAVDLRWDWDAHGDWDTGWSRTRAARHVVERPGRYAVRLEARDEAGATAVAERAILVTGVTCRDRPPGGAGSPLGLGGRRHVGHRVDDRQDGLARLRGVACLRAAPRGAGHRRRDGADRAARGARPGAAAERAPERRGVA